MLWLEEQGDPNPNCSFIDIGHVQELRRWVNVSGLPTISLAGCHGKRGCEPVWLLAISKHPSKKWMVDAGKC